MADEQRASDGGAKAFDIVGGVVGLLVFIAGIAMIVIVFTWVRDVFDSVDTQVQEVRVARTQAEMAAAEAQAEAELAGETMSDEDEDVVVATPNEGPTIGDVGITIGLKMLGLLILGWLGALVASKGAQLAGAHRGKRE
ncbi:MAG: hypothetical protein ACOCX2_12055 [Armatimonadota bacterium]